MQLLSEQQIKENIYEILYDFATYCDTYKLRYYLCGGTLLGAIRHKDFIPWDDDIDVLMPRPDYIQLHETLKSCPLRKRYQFLSLENRNSIYPFGKIVDLSTAVESSLSCLDKHLWIDIFPMDGTPVSQKESNNFLKKAHRLKKWHIWSSMLVIGPLTLKKILKIPVVLAAHLAGAEYFAAKLQELACQYDFEKSEYVAGVAWSCGPGERMKKDKFLPTTEVLFHGGKFHAPECWDFYLKSMYGEYNQLPPEDKRNTHMIKAYRIEEVE